MMLCRRTTPRSLQGLACAYFIFFSSLIWSAETGPGLSFAEALRLALQQSPRLQVSTRQLAATQQWQESADQLSAPIVSVAIDNLPISGTDRFSLGDDFMTMRRFSWMQEITNNDKRAAQKDMAQAQQNVIHVNRQREQQLVERETAMAWLARFYREQQLQKLTAIEQENQQLTLLARQQFAQGKINADEVLLAQQGVIDTTLVRDELNSQRMQAMTQLTRWVGPDAERPLVGEPPVWSLELDTLQRHLDRHPDLQALTAQRRVQQSKIAEAKAALQADWSYEWSYQKRGDEFGDMVSLQWSIELPFFNRGRRNAELSLHFAEADVLEAERERMRREYLALLTGQFAEYQRLQQKQQRLHNEMLPLLAQKYELMKSQWRNGKSQLRDVIAVRQELLRTELNVINVQLEIAQLTVFFVYNYRVDGNASEGQIP